MRVIAESSSTKSVWTLVEQGDILEKVKTEGINPLFQSRREISHIIRLGLPESFFKRRWEHVDIYCAGCTSAEKKKIVEASAVAQFKTPVTVESNLLGAARGLLKNNAGIACILDTGSSSCQYNGSEIIKRVSALGFILGDEGSGASLGKIFLSDCLKGLAPKDITASFYDRYNVTTDEVIDKVYTTNYTNKWLSKYASFLNEHIENEYVYTLVRAELKRFFVRNILQYEYEQYPVSFMGDVACMFPDLLNDIAQELGVTIGTIEKSSLSGLIDYHSTEK